MKTLMCADLHSVYIYIYSKTYSIDWLIKHRTTKCVIQLAFISAGHTRHYGFETTRAYDAIIPPAT